MKSGLWYQETQRATKAKVTFPAHWAKITEAWKTRVKYSDFYAKDLLKENIIKVLLKPQELNQMRGVTRLPSGELYLQPKDMEQLSLFEKAAIASVFPPARRALKLSDAQYSAAKEFATLQRGENGQIRLEDIYSWAEGLQVSVVKLLMSLNMDERIAVYSILREKDLNLSNSSEMKPIKDSIKGYLIDGLSKPINGTKWEEEHLWQLIKTLGFQDEMWATAFLKAPWIRRYADGLRRKIIGDIFTDRIVFNDKGQRFFDQATKYLGREAVLIWDFNDAYLDRDDWPDYLWKWAVTTSSYPILPNATSVEVREINGAIRDLNSFLRITSGIEIRPTGY